MKRELVEGYLFEVTKSLPRRDRKEIIEKLEPEINEKIDMVKKGDIETKDEVLSVLEEYGDPREIAAKYSSRKNDALIPQPHFAHYNKDKSLSYLIAIVAVILLSGFSYFGLQYFTMDFPDILTIINTVITSFVTIYVAYTISFSLVSSSRLKGWDSFSKSLRAAPSRSGKAGIVGITFQIIVSTLLFVLIGFGSNFLHFSFDRIDTGIGVTVLLLVPVILIYFFDVLNIAYKEIDRRYTFGVLLTTIIKALGIIGLSYLLFIQESIITLEFKEYLSVITPDQNVINTLIENLNLVVFLVIVFFAVFDLVSTAFSYHEDRKESVAPMDRPDAPYADKDIEETIEKDTERKDSEDDEVVVKETAVIDEDGDISATQVIERESMIQAEERDSDIEKREEKLEARKEREEILEERENIKENDISDNKDENPIADAVKNANPDNR